MEAVKVRFAFPTPMPASDATREVGAAICIVMELEGSEYPDETTPLDATTSNLYEYPDANPDIAAVFPPEIVAVASTKAPPLKDEYTV